ncbi:hypothetical protein, partial [Serratia fonticola]|uniref:hypothetical protein n=1 Tax=Serratia fonticola TaxID=47917 RepID=UPI001C68ED49
HLSPAEQFHLLAAENIDSAMFADLSTLMRHNLFHALPLTRQSQNVIRIAFFVSGKMVCRVIITTETISPSNS